jgi:hypothetical protein
MKRPTKAKTPRIMKVRMVRMDLLVSLWDIKIFYNKGGGKEGLLGICMMGEIGEEYQKNGSVNC